MLLSTDSVSVHPGPGGTLALVASIGAVVALLIACAMQARALASLRDKLEEPEPADRARADAPDQESGRRPGVRFGGLYEERADLLAPLRNLPGAPSLAVAALCAVVALVLAAASRGSPPRPDPAAREEVAALRAALDSVSRRVGQLSDLVRGARLSDVSPGRAPQPARHPPARRQVVTSAPAQPKAAPGPEIPPGPVLNPSVPAVHAVP